MAFLKPSPDQGLRFRPSALGLGRRYKAQQPCLYLSRAEVVEWGGRGEEPQASPPQHHQSRAQGHTHHHRHHHHHHRHGSTFENRKPELLSCSGLQGMKRQEGFPVVPSVGSIPHAQGQGWGNSVTQLLGHTPMP